jgi:hypothetical protein
MHIQADYVFLISLFRVKQFTTIICNFALDFSEMETFSHEGCSYIIHSVSVLGSIPANYPVLNNTNDV